VHGRRGTNMGIPKCKENIGNGWFLQHLGAKGQVFSRYRGLGLNWGVNLVRSGYGGPARRGRELVETLIPR